ncbi:unnamed protein product [Vitrella brassicaformis CCMP3155]|uniref:Uncharacterized protein n=1 Tax=Vitrella brassicaformis (strain CCMP3155) TaxID=1169540 RepID=A0A0G4FMV5_VITBC|nr:unnamed protein product [Vitrella brassicaformis CCMP3155]|eukprot:CEM14914.1 unnamed protein product [Vitrella brassicaformis CCMP3155]
MSSREGGAPRPPASTAGAVCVKQEPQADRTAPRAIPDLTMSPPVQQTSHGHHHDAASSGDPPDGCERVETEGAQSGRGGGGGQGEVASSSRHLRATALEDLEDDDGEEEDEMKLLIFRSSALLPPTTTGDEGESDGAEEAQDLRGRRRILAARKTAKEYHCLAKDCPPGAPAPPAGDPGCLVTADDGLCQSCMRAYRVASSIFTRLHRSHPKVRTTFTPAPPQHHQTRLHQDAVTVTIGPLTDTRGGRYYLRDLVVRPRNKLPKAVKPRDSMGGWSFFALIIKIPEVLRAPPDPDKDDFRVDSDGKRVFLRRKSLRDFKTETRAALDAYPKQRLQELRVLNGFGKINISWHKSAWEIQFYKCTESLLTRTISPQARTQEAIDKALEEAVQTRNELASDLGRPPIRSLPSRELPGEDRHEDRQGDYEVAIEGSGGEPEDEDKDENEEDNQGDNAALTSWKEEPTDPHQQQQQDQVHMGRKGGDDGNRKAPKRGREPSGDPFGGACALEKDALDAYAKERQAELRRLNGSMATHIGWQNNGGWVIQIHLQNQPKTCTFRARARTREAVDAALQEAVDKRNLLAKKVRLPPLRFPPIIASSDGEGEGNDGDEMDMAEHGSGAASEKDEEEEQKDEHDHKRRIRRGAAAGWSRTAVARQRDALDAYGKHRLTELRRLNGNESINIGWHNLSWQIQFWNKGGRLWRNISLPGRTREAVDKALEEAIHTRNQLAKNLGRPPIRSLQSGHGQGVAEGSGEARGEGEDGEVEGCVGAPEDEEEEEQDETDEEYTGKAQKRPIGRGASAAANGPPQGASVAHYRPPRPPPLLAAATRPPVRPPAPRVSAAEDAQMCDATDQQHNGVPFSEPQESRQVDGNWDEPPSHSPSDVRDAAASAAANVPRLPPFWRAMPPMRPPFWQPPPSFFGGRGGVVMGGMGGPPPAPGSLNGACIAFLPAVRPPITPAMPGLTRQIHGTTRPPPPPTPPSNRPSRAAYGDKRLSNVPLGRHRRIDQTPPAAAAASGRNERGQPGGNRPEHGGGASAAARLGVQVKIAPSGGGNSVQQGASESSRTEGQQKQQQKQMVPARCMERQLVNLDHDDLVKALERDEKSQLARRVLHIVRESGFNGSHLHEMRGMTAAQINSDCLGNAPQFRGQALDLRMWIDQIYNKHGGCVWAPVRIKEEPTEGERDGSGGEMDMAEHGSGGRLRETRMRSKTNTTAKRGREENGEEHLLSRLQRGGEGEAERDKDGQGEDADMEGSSVAPGDEQDQDDEQDNAFDGASVDRDALGRYAKHRLAELRRLNDARRLHGSGIINLGWHNSAWQIQFCHKGGRLSRTIRPPGRTQEAIDKALEEAINTRNQLARDFGRPPLRSLQSGRCHGEGEAHGEGEDGEMEGCVGAPEVEQEEEQDETDEEYGRKPQKRARGREAPAGSSADLEKDALDRCAQAAPGRAASP